MTMVAGVDRPLISSRLGARRSSLGAGFLRFGIELVPGMHVQLGDGRWAVVADEITLADRGRVSVPVRSWPELVAEAAEDVEPERLLVGYGVRVRTRTPAEERAYVEAVWAAEDQGYAGYRNPPQYWIPKAVREELAADAAITREGMGK